MIRRVPRNKRRVVVLLCYLVAALCALLIAAANFAGLLVTRVIEREGEFALRAALGASWQRLVRQQLLQALLLSVLGTLGGLLIASWITPALVAMSPEGTDTTGSAMREFDYAVRFDWPVFTFAAGRAGTEMPLRPTHER